MSEQGDSPTTDYPLGRGYGHDYMRGGEVFGGYGYAQREEYERSRGELTRTNGSAGIDASGADAGDVAAPEASEGAAEDAAGGSGGAG